MNRHLLAAIGLLVLGVQTCSAVPNTDDVSSKVQKQLDRCLVPVTLTLNWQIKGKDSNYTHKGNGVIISPQGAVMVQGKCDSSLAWNMVGDHTKVTFTGQPQVKLPDGRTLTYRLKAYYHPNDFSILVPDKPSGPMSYLDITQPYRLPLGLPVISAIQSDDHKEVSVKHTTVQGVPDQPLASGTFYPEHLIFSTLSGQFMGWSGDDFYGVSVWTLDTRTWDFISQNAGIQVKPAIDNKEPVDPTYQRVYDSNKNSMGTLRFQSDENFYDDTTYYALTASGDIMVVLPSKVLEQVSRPNSEPAKAILPDGTKCQMRWKKTDTTSRVAILSPVIPLKQPLTPVTWRTSSLPQIGDTVYGCFPSCVMGGVVDGYDPSCPDRITLDSIEPAIIFDSDGRAAAFAMHSENRVSLTCAYNGAYTTVSQLRSLVPGIQLSVDSETHVDPSHPIITKIPHDIRNWGYLNPDLQPNNDYICSLVCIDGSGYFVLPYSDWFNDGKTTHPVADSTPQQIRSAFLSTEFDSAIVDDEGQIGVIATVFTSEKLGMSIGKMRKPPIRPMKAIDLSACRPPAPGEKCYSVDASLVADRLMQIFTSHTVIQSAEYPFTGVMDRGEDHGALCYSLDGQPRGYVTITVPSTPGSPLMLVDMAEIAKKLALVKEALGDK
ncbi:MAG: hypothetical protein ACYC1M_18615 [Armatimonadota bacterium]